MKPLAPHTAALVQAALSGALWALIIVLVRAVR